MFFRGFYILNTQPLIVSFWRTNTSDSESIYQKLRLYDSSFEAAIPSWFRPKHILEHIPWWSAPWQRMARFKVKQVISASQPIVHHLMVNAFDEETSRRRFLVRGAHFSANIYINENLYKPLGESKIYDAIYTAQLTDFKRHWLAKEVKRLMVVSYGGDLHEFCPELKHAEFNKQFISRPELAKKYNQSYAGLCLSAEEGAMLASCEYLLCGIPVVSTHSKGGRDEFFTQQNSIVVPPEPEAVAKAVQYWQENPPDPEEIRQQTLNKIVETRRGYCTYIAQLIKKSGGGKKDPEVLMHKLFSEPDGIASRFVAVKDLHKVKLEDYALDL